MSDQTVFNVMDDLLAALSDEVEARRLDLHRGRRLLIVMGFDEGKLPLYQRAQALGVKLVILDGPGHWAQAFVGTGLIETFIEVDLNDNETLLDRALSAIRASGLRFDGVATFCDYATHLTSQIAAALKLPGHRAKSTEIVATKYDTRKVFESAGFPTPRFARIRSANDLVYAGAYVGFPAMLKPVSGGTANTVYRVENLWMLKEYYRRITELNSQQADMILEECLEGDEFDIDCLLCDGQMVYSSVTSQDPQPYRMDSGVSLPANYSAYKQAELVELARQALRTLKFSNGAVQVEAIYTSRGPRLLNVKAQISGERSYVMNQAVWGVDLLAQYLLTCLGVPIRPQKATEPVTYLTTYDFTAPFSGMVTCDYFLDHLSDDARVVMIEKHVTLGQYVVGPEDGVPDYLGEVIVCGESCYAAHQALQAIIAQVNLMIVPDDVPNVMQVA